MELIDEKMNKFLETNKFGQDSPLSDEELKEVIKKLKRTEVEFNIDLLDKEYRKFLNKYGSIHGEGYRIIGSSSRINKINHSASVQLGFENCCKIDGIKEKIVKSCWLMASIDQEDQYYFNLASKNKNYIYSLNHEGRTKIYAKNFLDFLDKFFESFQRKDEEREYANELFETEDNESSE